MCDEEAGRSGKHVRQFGQTRTHFSGGKLWFGGWGVEPFDGKRRINLFAPIAGDLPNQQFFGSWLQLPPIAGIVRRALRAQAHVELAFGIERKSVVEGKSVAVSVDLGGRRIIK